MTEQEFLALPDEQKNALVAEKVMGLVPQVDFGKCDEHDWKRYDDGAIDICAYEDGDIHNGPACKRCGYGYCHHCEDGPSKPCEISPRPYTTEDYAALAVVDRMVANDYPFVLHYLQDRKRWHATFDGMTYEAFAPTRRLAIILAAVKALGIIE